MSENIHQQNAIAGMREAAKVDASRETALGAIQLQSQLAIAYELRTANMIAAMSILGTASREKMSAELYARLGLS